MVLRGVVPLASFLEFPKLLRSTRLNPLVAADELTAGLLATSLAVGLGFLFEERTGVDAAFGLDCAGVSSFLLLADRGDSILAVVWRTMRLDICTGVLSPGHIDSVCSVQLDRYCRKREYVDKLVARVYVFGFGATSM